MVRIENAVNQHLRHPMFEKASLHVDVKRLDLIHPEINGNKWFKLKYNLQTALESNHKTILTFGGAWSNHIYSTASAGKLAGIKTIGIIRGEEPLHWSYTLKHAKQCGMQLEFIDRLAYAEKDTEDFIGWLHEEYGSFHLVPEGGSNFLGVNGCMEILNDTDKSNYDYICCSCGTGATLAGILLSSSEQQKLLGFSALKSGEFLVDEVRKCLRSVLMNEDSIADFKDQYKIMTDYHFGGYGKWTDSLVSFIQEMESDYELPLDQIYTGKMLFGMVDLASQGFFPKDSRILIIHSGGLQGRQSLPL